METFKVFFDVLAEAHLNSRYVSAGKERFTLNVRDLLQDLQEIIGIQCLFCFVSHCRFYVIPRFIH